MFGLQFPLIVQYLLYQIKMIQIDMSELETFFGNPIVWFIGFVLLVALICFLIGFEISQSVLG